MLGLRQLLPPQLLLNASGTIIEQTCVAASLPSLAQHWSSQLQLSCCMATAKQASRVPTKHEKRVANARFCRARAAWRREVQKLRKQWYSEYLDRLDARKQSAEEAKQQVAQLRKLRSESKQVDKTMHNLDREIREAERAVLVAGLRWASSMRQDYREQTLEKFRQQRRNALVEQSRTWIPKEQLESRIAEALDNPVDL